MTYKERFTQIKRDLGVARTTPLAIFQKKEEKEKERIVLYKPGRVYVRRGMF